MYRLLLLFLLLTGALLPAQQSVLHPDRPYHAAGEVLRFRAYFPVAVPTKVRVDVYAPDGRSIDYFFVRTREGVADGYYRWNFDLPTGYYRLRFTALAAAEDRIVDLGTFRRAVYNVGDRKADAADAPAADATPEAGDLRVAVADGRLTATGLPAGTYSLSVYNTEVTGAADPLATAGAEVVTAYRDTLFYGGYLSEREGGGPVAVNLLPFFDTRSLRTYFSKSDDQGRYVLTVPSFEGETRVQARGIGEEAVQAALRFPDLKAVDATPPLTAEVLAYLDLGNRRRKIYQLYGGVETPLDGEPRPQAVMPLEPNEAFNVQDYKAFPDMLTFFNEVAGELRYRRRRGELTARLYNAPNQRFFTGTPLFIVDGRLTRDVDYVAALSPADVRTLAYYYDNRELRRDFPALGGHGVVQIELLRDNGKFPVADADNVLPIRGLQPAQDFARAGDAPRLNPLLLWDSGTTAGGTLTIDLPQTDDPGTYRAVLVVRDAATGAVRRGGTTVAVAASR